MAQYTEYTTTTQLQPPVISQAPTIATQYVEPTIQNTNGITYAQAYTGQPIIYTQPGYAKVVAAPTQQMVTAPQGQKPEQQQSIQLNDDIGNLRSQIQKSTVDEIQNNIIDKKEEAKKTKEELEKLRQELEQYKQKEAEVEQNESINKQVEEKTEKKMSDLEDRENQINDKLDALEYTNTSAFTDPNALRNYLDEIDNISDIKKFRSLIEEEYGNLKKENEKNKEKNGSYLKTLEDQLSKNQQEITSKQTELNRHQSSKSFIKKIIEWISGSKDKKGQELKERLAELRKEVEGNMADIKEQRGVLKKILLEGAQIMQKETEEMKKIDSENMEKLFNKREQLKKIEESKEIKQNNQDSLINTIRGNTSNIRDLTQIRSNFFYKTYGDLETIYPQRDRNNNKPKTDLNSINRAKRNSLNRGG